MSNTKKPELAAYAEKDITPVMREYIAWLEKETGYKVDPISVQLSSMLRPAFQKSPGNQKRMADAKAARVTAAQAKVERRAERGAKAKQEAK
ncbi:hypothetical protein ACFOE1_05210 [Agromyces mediolanus]|uniref:Uncharacterized protein n=1 Tax=Agromyces mediolanus TaxID=41986 RepID=A0A918CML5_AGRME|nr:hypothetical protein [Agromyces mediolanus]GGR28877.1 hypothetical protein GCM10010196_23430 [Agromyces mediolanus]GLJ72139.1 hypothetical protein GCM10017583_13950 [Agromyces mediolanus]